MKNKKITRKCSETYEISKILLHSITPYDKFHFEESPENNTYVNIILDNGNWNHFQFYLLQIQYAEISQL